MFISEDYQPSSIDIDIFLSEVSIPLMKEGIQNQFNEPLDNNNNYVDVFVDKYTYGLDLLKETNDDDFKAQLDSMRDDFMQYMLKEFKTKLAIGVPNFEDLGVEKQNEIVQNVYTYFILNIKKNYVNIVINYIGRYKKSILDSFKKKKDVTALSFKKEITDSDDLIIITNLKDIIDTVLSTEFEVTQFIELTTIEDCYENEWLSEAYDNVDVTGNFVANYIELVDDNFRNEIESKIRNKILKKYRIKENIL